MDKKLEEKLNQKIIETQNISSDVFKIAKLFDISKIDSDSFVYGIIIGRLYNSFYYQCRRIMKRDPTEQEFGEFLSIIQSKQDYIRNSLNLR